MTDKKELSDDDIKYESLVRQKELKVAVLDEIEHKEAEVVEMLAIVKETVKTIPMKIKIFEDALETLIDSQDLFVGDNPEVLVGTDKTRFEYINDMLKGLNDLLCGAETEVETLQSMKDRYAREEEKLESEIDDLGVQMTEVANRIAAAQTDRKAPTKKGTPQAGMSGNLKRINTRNLFSWFPIFIMGMGWIMILNNLDLSKYIFEPGSEYFMSAVYPFMLIFIGYYILLTNPFKKRRRRRY